MATQHKLLSLESIEETERRKLKTPSVVVIGDLKESQKMKKGFWRSLVDGIYRFAFGRPEIWVNISPEEVPRPFERNSKAWEWEQVNF